MYVASQPRFFLWRQLGSSRGYRMRYVLRWAKADVNINSMNAMFQETANCKIHCKSQLERSLEKDSLRRSHHGFFIHNVSAVLQGC